MAKKAQKMRVAKNARMWCVSGFIKKIVCAIKMKKDCGRGVACVFFCIDFMSLWALCVAKNGVKKKLAKFCSVVIIKSALLSLFLVFFC